MLTHRAGARPKLERQLNARDATQGAILRTWLDGHVLTAFADRILTIDTAVARQCAQLHVPDPKSERDAFIAATALVHGMIVVTRNFADFAAIPVTTLNPWDHAIGAAR